MCYEFSSLFEKARARQLRKEQQRQEAQKHEPAPTVATSQPAEPKPLKARETIPV